MKIALLQADITWEDPKASLSTFERLTGSLSSPADLIMLPEMFTTGFTMNPAPVAETMDGPTVKWMRQMAGQHNAAVTGSLVIAEDGRHYNRLIFAFPDGTLKTYDKRHLFTLAGEDKAYTAGTERLIVDFRGWRICPLVCYDLRFPVFSRNTDTYDLLLYVANWPAPRIAAWDALLKARAIENMCYVAGLNRVGQDANGHSYPGHSKVLDCFGNTVLASAKKEGVLIVDIHRESLSEARKKFSFLEDRDNFSLLS